MTSENKLVIHWSKTKILLAALLIIVILGGFGEMAVTAINQANAGSGAMALFLIIGVLVLLNGLVVILRKLFDGSSGLTLSTRGIYVNTSNVYNMGAYTSGMFPWHRIAAVQVYTGRWGRSLSLRLRDTDKPVRIYTTYLDISFDDLVKVLKEYHQEYGTSH